MFLEGMVRMWAEQPDMFWRFIWAITPGVALGVFVGMYERSRELCGWHYSGRRMVTQYLFMTGIALAWTWQLYPEWFPLGNTETLLLIVFAIGVALSIPIAGGCLVGIWIFSAYWGLKQFWVRHIRNMCRSRQFY